MTYFDLTILESSISIMIYFGIFFSCSLRTIGYCDLSLMPSDADRDFLSMCSVEKWLAMGVGALRGCLEKPIVSCFNK